MSFVIPFATSPRRNNMSSSTALDKAAHGAFETIQIFTHELPDPDGLLSLHTFYRFQELPIEIRLQIWRETFPGPRVFKLLFPRYSTANSRILPNRPPTAHAVNQESRAELFRVYRYVRAVIPLINDISDIGLILFSPGKEVLSVSCWEFHYHVCYWKYPVTDSFTSLLYAIRKIEIFGQKRCVRSAGNSASYQHSELFKMFKNLEEVRIVEKDPKRLEVSGERVATCGYWRNRVLDYKPFRDHIYEELKLRTERDPSIKIPAITSWDVVLKDNPASSPRIEMGWFKNRVQYYKLIPAVEYDE